MAEKCQCELCLLSRRIEKEKSKMTPETLLIIKDLWNAWEEASTDRCYLRSKYVDKTWPSNDENILAGVH